MDVVGAEGNNNDWSGQQYGDELEMFFSSSLLWSVFNHGMKMMISLGTVLVQPGAVPVNNNNNDHSSCSGGKIGSTSSVLSEVRYKEGSQDEEEAEEEHYYY